MLRRTEQCISTPEPPRRGWPRRPLPSFPRCRQRRGRGCARLLFPSDRRGPAAEWVWGRTAMRLPGRCSPRRWRRRLSSHPKSAIFAAITWRIYWAAGRRGLLLRRPLDARNADRARFLLAMAWLSCVGPTDEAIDRASELLDARPEVRPALSPVQVMKYLASRDTPAKHQWFRQVRRRLKERCGLRATQCSTPRACSTPA